MIATLLGIAGLMLVLALGYFVSFWLAGGLLLGAGLIPGLILLLGDAVPMKRAFGNINYTLGAVTAGGAAIIYERDGAGIYPYDKDEHALYRDGDWEDISVDLNAGWSTYRLGLAPLVIGYDAEDALTPYEVSDLPESAPSLLDETRGGYALFSEHARGEENLVVHVGKYIKEVGRAGTRLYNRTEEEALKKYGGDEQMAQIYLMAMLFGAFLIMFVVTYVILGL